MVSSYTANLAAFLTVENLVSPISNAEELANLNGKIKYGAKRDGSTISFFREGEYPTYQKMWQFMSNHPEHLTSSNIEGVERVKTQNYAFLMESTSIEYTVERECDVTQVGGLLDDKGYGIAMRKSKEIAPRVVVVERCVNVHLSQQIRSIAVRCPRLCCGCKSRAS